MNQLQRDHLREQLCRLRDPRCEERGRLLSYCRGMINFAYLGDSLDDLSVARVRALLESALNHNHMKAPWPEPGPWNPF